MLGKLKVSKVICSKEEDEEELLTTLTPTDLTLDTECIRVEVEGDRYIHVYPDGDVLMFQNGIREGKRMKTC